MACRYHWSDLKERGNVSGLPNGPVLETLVVHSVSLLTALRASCALVVVPEVGDAAAQLVAQRFGVQSRVGARGQYEKAPPNLRLGRDDGDERSEVGVAFKGELAASLGDGGVSRFAMRHPRFLGDEHEGSVDRHREWSRGYRPPMREDNPGSKHRHRSRLRYQILRSKLATSSPLLKGGGCPEFIEGQGEVWSTNKTPALMGGFRLFLSFETCRGLSLLDLLVCLIPPVRIYNKLTHASGGESLYCHCPGLVRHT